MIEKYTELANYFEELASLQDYITSYSSGSGLTDISLKDLYEMLRNPYKNIFRIQSTSRYFANRFGIVKDVNEAFRSLPSLNYHLVWSNFDKPEKIKKYEKRIYDLLDILNIKRTVRDGLGELAEIGTVVVVNRNNKYLQFLELENLRINKQINGKWVVEYDLQTLKKLNNMQDRLDIIESLPDEINVNAYNNYLKNGEKDRYVEIKNAYVLNIRGQRNFPFGFPYSLPAWGALIHKSLIEQVEKSVADRAIKALLVLYVKSINANNEAYKPPPKDVVSKYFNNVSNLIKKRDSGVYSNTTDSAGTGVVSLPEFLELQEIKLNTNIFPKELYEKLEKDILSSLGISGALVNGGGIDSSFGSAQLNSEKFFSYIFTALEQWEDMINDIIKSILPNDLNCRFYFDRTTITDKKSDIEAKYKLYMQTGIATPWLESVLSVPYHYVLGIAEYEQKVLGLDKLLTPPQNAFTQSGTNKIGRPESDTTNDNNIKAKGNNSNQIPSPSDN